MDILYRVRTLRKTLDDWEECMVGRRYGQLVKMLNEHSLTGANYSYPMHKIRGSVGLPLKRRSLV